MKDIRMTESYCKDCMSMGQLSTTEVASVVDKKGVLVDDSGLVTVVKACMHEACFAVTSHKDPINGVTIERYRVEGCETLNAKYACMYFKPKQRTRLCEIAATRSRDEKRGSL